MKNVLTVLFAVALVGAAGGQRMDTKFVGTRGDLNNPLYDAKQKLYLYAGGD